MNGDWRKLLKALRDQGWTIEQKRRCGHMRASPPGSKRVVLIPGSPGDHRAWVSTRAKLRRLGFQG